MVNYETFKALLSGSKIRMAVIGGVIACAGAAMLISLLVMHETKIAYWIVTGICVVLGFPMLIFPLRDLARIRSGTWPLLKAISEGQNEYIVWIYNNEVVGNVSGVEVSKSSNLILYNRYGKMIQVVLGKKASASANEVIRYLASEFPNAHIGYSDQARQAVGRLLNKNM